MNKRKLKKLLLIIIVLSIILIILNQQKVETLVGSGTISKTKQALVSE